MSVLEDNICALSAQFVDHLGYSFLISRNWIGAENDGVIRLDRNLLVNIGRHTGKSRHRLSLTSCSDKDHFVIRVILNLVDLYQSLVRYLKVPQFCGSTDHIYHAPSLYRYFSSVFIGRIDDLLHPVYIRRKGCNNDPGIPMLGKNIIKRPAHSAFRHGKALSFRISTVAHQSQDTFLSDLCKSLQVNGIPEYRSIIHFKVSSMNYCARRRIDSQSRRVLNTVVGLDKFNPETAQINGLSVFYHLSFCSPEQIMFF